MFFFYQLSLSNQLWCKVAERLHSDWQSKWVHEWRLWQQSWRLVIGRLLVRLPWSACPSDVVAWQPPPSMYVYMNYCKLLWTKASAIYCMLNKKRNRGPFHRDSILSQQPRLVFSPPLFPLNVHTSYLFCSKWHNYIITISKQRTLSGFHSWGGRLFS